MSPFRTILFAADFSERSKGPYSVARWLARSSGSRLIVFHAVVPVLFGESSGPPGSAGLPPFLPSDTPAHRAELAEELRKWYPPCDPLDVTYEVKHGDDAEQILEAAGEHAADLIVMGTHGRTGLERLVAGSVAETVLRRASCPVVAFRSLAAEPEPDGFRLILVPTDASDNAGAAIQVGRSLAQIMHSPLVLLRVVSAHDRTDLESHWEALQALKTQVEEGGTDGKVSVEVRVVVGEPAVEIVRSAGELGADLIVMGSHGRTGLAHLLMGSVAEHVIRQATCPTLVVKRNPQAHAGSEKGPESS